MPTAIPAEKRERPRQAFVYRQCGELFCCACNHRWNDGVRSAVTRLRRLPQHSGGTTAPTDLNVPGQWGVWQRLRFQGRLHRLCPVLTPETA